MKKILLFLIMFFVIGTIACDDIDDLHGIWLRKEVYASWQKGEDKEDFATKDIELNGEIYQSIWIYLAINMKSTPKYFSYWGSEFIIDKIEKNDSPIRLSVHLSYREAAKGVFDIVFLDRDSFRMTMVSMNDELWEDVQNSFFTPDRIDTEEVYIRCPKKKVGAKTN